MTVGVEGTNKPRASILQRRKIGAYYTPRSLAETISRWAIKEPSDLVLEPSFGGCDFISAAATRLRNLGATTPWKSIFGADIDPFAFTVLRELGAGEIAIDNFRLADFLSLTPSDFPSRTVDALICNPPYVRHHNFSAPQRALIRSLKNNTLPPLSLQANLWAFFILHGCSFLNEGGRAAWVLPYSFLHATYAGPVRDYLRQHFHSVTAITVRQRLFKGEGTDEGTVVVLADNWSSQRLAGRPIRSHDIDTLAAMQLLLSNQNEVSNVNERTSSSGLPWTGMQSLGDFCQFRLGIVTGDAEFFLFNREKAESFGIADRYLRPIISRARQVPGLQISTAELSRAFDAGERTAILDTTTGASPAVSQYLASKAADEIAANVTFGKRPIWHQPFDSGSPHAFFTGMSHRSPRLVLNANDLDCTNTLYRVNFLTSSPVETRCLVSLSMISTPSQLSAELEGRSYGAGLLKHEPSDAKRIKVFTTVRQEYVTSLLVAYREVDRALKSGKEDGAVELADRFLVGNDYLTEGRLTYLRAELARLRQNRLR